MVARFPLIIIIILYPYEERPGGLGEGKELALLLMLLFPPFTLRPAPSVGKAWVGGSRASRVAPLTGSIQLPPSDRSRGRRHIFLLGERHKDGSPTRGLGPTTGRRAWLYVAPFLGCCRPRPVLVASALCLVLGSPPGGPLSALSPPRLATC